MDALDCLLTYNYKIVKEPGLAKEPMFRLCGAKATISCMEDKAAVAGWTQEIEESFGYYTDRIVAIGRAML